MENENIIRTFLKKDYKEYCDDCISELTSISPRNQVNQICNKSTAISSNENGICSYCGKTKKTRFVIDINNPPKEVLEALSWANSYANTEVVHSQELKETEKKLKKILDCDFESNLYLKLKEFSAYVCAKSGISKFDSFASNEFIEINENYKKEHMGLTTWKNSPDGRILKSDVNVAKNYLSEKQIRQLERTISGYFDYIEDLIEREIPFDMKSFATSVNEFLEFRKYDILEGNGRISRTLADEKSFNEYKIFNKTQMINSDFDEMIKQLEK